VKKQERNILDDLVELGRELVEQLDDVLNPDKKQRKPARVPVPVRPDQRRPQPDERDPYQRY